ncbi:MAG: TlpA family protein disulfide reductase [Acidobacteriia bacterium]|nr:TlpA family protein disulfide reductase [Terriglobia bacterium]
MRTVIFTLLCALMLLAADPVHRAPGFSLPDLRAEQHDLADYRGKVVLLEFMQSTCPHCAAFTEVLNKVQQKYGAKVGILAVANPPDNQNTVAAYISGHQITYPILFDCGQVAYSYLRVVQFDLPQVFLIDAKGMVQHHYEYGPMTRDIFEGDGLSTEIDRLLAATATPRNASQKK